MLAIYDYILRVSRKGLINQTCAHHLFPMPAIAVKLSSLLLFCSTARRDSPTSCPA